MGSQQRRGVNRTTVGPLFYLHNRACRAYLWHMAPILEIDFPRVYLSTIFAPAANDPTQPFWAKLVLPIMHRKNGGENVVSIDDSGEEVEVPPVIQRLFGIGKNAHEHLVELVVPLTAEQAAQLAPSIGKWVQWTSALSDAPQVTPQPVTDPPPRVDPPPTSDGPAPTVQ